MIFMFILIIGVSSGFGVVLVKEFVGFDVFLVLVGCNEDWFNVVVEICNVKGVIVYLFVFDISD